MNLNLKAIFTIIAFSALLNGGVAAADVKKTNMKAQISPGSSIEIGRHAGWTKACKDVGLKQIKLLKKPAFGNVEILKKKLPAPKPKNQTFSGAEQCAGKPFNYSMIIYTAPAGKTGSVKIQYSVTYPHFSGKQIRTATIKVK